jgi:hypothetical protein
MSTSQKSINNQFKTNRNTVSNNVLREPNGQNFNSLQSFMDSMTSNQQNLVLSRSNLVPRKASIQQKQPKSSNNKKSTLTANIKSQSQLQNYPSSSMERVLGMSTQTSNFMQPQVPSSIGNISALSKHQQSGSTKKSKSIKQTQLSNTVVMTNNNGRVDRSTLNQT